jgi:uncharacterized delta-60 repeat protein
MTKFWAIASLMISTITYGQQGTLDLSFGNNGYVRTPGTEKAFDLAIQSDGKVILAGFTGISAHQQNFCLVRYNQNGSLDNQFGNAGIVTTEILPLDLDNAFAVEVLANGQILVGGYMTMPNLGSYFVMVRYNANGTIDSSFASNSAGSPSFFPNGVGRINDFKIQPNGKIVAVGSNSQSHFVVYRFHANGSVDSTFNGTGSYLFNMLDEQGSNSLELQADGKIVVVGAAKEPYSSAHNELFALIVRLDSNGTLDQTFNSIGFDTVSVNNAFGSSFGDVLSTSLAIQADGKILLPVNYKTIYGKRSFVIRYNANGSLDQSFGDQVTLGSTELFEGKITDIKVLSDSKIVVLSNRDEIYFSSDEFMVSRLLSNGIFDNSFGNNWPPGNSGQSVFVLTGDDYMTSLGILQNGKILAGGWSDFQFQLARINNTLSIGITEEINDVTNGFNVYPNPCYNEINLSYTLKSSNQLSIDLYDLHGRYLQKLLTNQERALGSHTERIELEKSISPGTYFIKVSTSQTVESFIIFKQ